LGAKLSFVKESYSLAKKTLVG